MTHLEETVEWILEDLPESLLDGLVLRYEWSHPDGRRAEYRRAPFPAITFYRSALRDASLEELRYVLNHELKHHLGLSHSEMN